MTHFGIFCPGTFGHLNPMCNLGAELIKRGHQVTLFGTPDAADKIAKSGLNFHEIGATDFPKGEMTKKIQQLGELDGLAALKFSIAFFGAEAMMLTREAPSAIKQAGVEALLIDQISLCVTTVADKLQLPFVTVYNALLLNREPGVPPFFTTWPYQDSAIARLRNRLGNALIANLTEPLWQLVVKQRQTWQLPPRANREEAASQLAQICQLPPSLDFPRQNLPNCLHYIGQLQHPEQASAPTTSDNFPWEKLTDQPLIYASLGTLQNRNWYIFEAIAAACEGLDAQLVVALGNPNQDINQVKLVGNPIVVAYAPQKQIIDRATLVITHAGLNTTLEALSAGVPMVAIPITNDQPGVAARMVRAGAGLLIPVKKVTADRLKAAVTEVFNNPSYKNNALKLQADIQAAGGVQKAADIVEQVIATGQPLLNTTV